MTWHLASLSPLHSLPGHSLAVLQLLSCGDLLVSLDKSGRLLLWDAARASLAGEEEALVRGLEVEGQEGVVGLDMDLRRLGLARVGGLAVMDFWDTATLATAPELVGADGHKDDFSQAAYWKDPIADIDEYLVN